MADLPPTRLSAAAVWVLMAISPLKDDEVMLSIPQPRAGRTPHTVHGEQPWYFVAVSVLLHVVMTPHVLHLLRDVNYVCHGRDVRYVCHRQDGMCAHPGVSTLGAL